MITPKICALVVTYNRKELLVENLAALLQQTFSLTEIIIIDNHSTPDLLAHLKENNYLDDYSANYANEGGIISKNICNHLLHTVRLTFKRLNSNIGGAGGFNHGMSYFYNNTSCELLWLMDDDCKPQTQSLENLAKAYSYLAYKRLVAVGFIASRVNWTDNTPCKVASPYIKKTAATCEYSAVTPYLELESAAFVSLLFPRDVIKAIGLPLKEYFIWNDDVEYTNRINKRYRSFMALDSLVTHQTQANEAAAEEITAENFFKNKYGIRNKISWLRQEKSVLHAIFFSLKFIKLITKAKISNINKIILLKSVAQGWYFTPKIEYLT